MFVWHDSFWLAYICRKEHKFIRSRSSSTLVRNVRSSKIFRRPSTPELPFLCCVVLGLPGCVQSHILILKYISSQRKRILALGCDVKTILPKRFPSSVTRISHRTLKTDTMARPDLRDSLRESFFFPVWLFLTRHNYWGSFQDLPREFKIIGDLKAALMAELGARHEGALRRESLWKVVSLICSKWSVPLWSLGPGLALISA